MLIKFEIYRSKNPDELIDKGKIRVDITTEEQLVRIDEVFLKVLDQYRLDLPIVQKNGTAYIGKVSVLDLEITNDDTAIDLTEEAFRHYMSTIIPNLPIIWSKTDKDIVTEEKPVKIENKEN